MRVRIKVRSAQDSHSHDSAAIDGCVLVISLRQRSLGRQMLLLFCLSIGIAEVFLDGPERDRLRNKFNEVIEKYGSELN